MFERGAQSFYQTGGTHIAPQDSIILVNADEVHTGHAAVEGGWAYKAMYPLPEQFATVAKEIGANTGAPYFPQAVVYDPELANQLRLVFETLEKSTNRLLRETLIYACLVKVMTRHGRTEPQADQPLSALRPLMLVKEFLDDFPQADVSLEVLAQLAGLSPFIWCGHFKTVWFATPRLSNPRKLAPRENPVKPRRKYLRNRARVWLSRSKPSSSPL